MHGLLHGAKSLRVPVQLTLVAGVGWEHVCVWGGSLPSKAEGEIASLLLSALSFPSAFRVAVLRRVRRRDILGDSLSLDVLGIGS